MTNGSGKRKILITGGAGFVGSNLAERLLREPAVQVCVFDSFARAGVVRNVEWLQTLPGSDRLQVVEGDVRDSAAVRAAVRDADEIYHLAGQVAVTSSVDDPAHDFSVNCAGTFNVLEAARRSGRRPFLLFTSTNKVYGSLEHLDVEIAGTRYRAADPGFGGVAESMPLDFHSPYGCSKGSADQYVRDYARLYDLPTVVFRMSCIAGPRQFGTEDQGWVAHFLYSVLAGKPITIYGDGFQVRDILHVYDLMDAMVAVRNHLPRAAGEIYNVGGGMERTVSVIDMLQDVKAMTGKPLHLQYSAVRPGDQPLYISDTAKLQAHTGWHPRRSLSETLGAIHDFWLEHAEAIHTQRFGAVLRPMAESVA